MTISSRGVETIPKVLGQVWRGKDRIPWPWVVVLTQLTLVLFLPIVALLFKASAVPPAQLWRLATSPIALSTYNITFVTAAIAAAINCVAGTATAWVLVRYTFPGRRLLDAVVDLPFALPTAVAGITLATIYSRNGWIGSLFTPFGVRIAFTRWGVGLAMVFISLPFVVRTVQPVLQETDLAVEEAAWSLGASRWVTFRRVLFPSLLPAILTGTTQAFARAVGEYGSVVLVAGNIPFQDLIAPILVFQRLEGNDLPGATAIGLVLLVISLGLLLLVNGLQAWGRRYEG